MALTTLLDLAMITCAEDCRARGCRRLAAAAAHASGRASSRLFQPGRQLHGDRHRIALGLLRAAISAAALGRLRHHQLWPHRMIVQILDAEPNAPGSDARQ